MKLYASTEEPKLQNVYEKIYVREAREPLTNRIGPDPADIICGYVFANITEDIVDRLLADMVKIEAPKTSAWIKLRRSGYHIHTYKSRYMITGGTMDTKEIVHTLRRNRRWSSYIYHEHVTADIWEVIHTYAIEGARVISVTNFNQ
jgi:hypothetical protein